MSEVRVTYSDEDLLLTDERGLLVRFRPSVLEVAGARDVLSFERRTHYSKHMTCLPLGHRRLDVRSVYERLRRLRTRLHVAYYETSVGAFLVVVFPGAFRYDRAIVKDDMLCVEHSRNARIEPGGSGGSQTVSILF